MARYFKHTSNFEHLVSVIVDHDCNKDILSRTAMGFTNKNILLTGNTNLELKKKIIKQVAQLSQRDRAAGWVSYGQKWKTGTGRQYTACQKNDTDVAGYIFNAHQPILIVFGR